ncbi:hypothetical protein B7463_g1804, partial [Scytalidium lignicola]
MTIDDNVVNAPSLPYCSAADGFPEALFSEASNLTRAKLCRLIESFGTMTAQGAIATVGKSVNRGGSAAKTAQLIVF